MEQNDVMVVADTTLQALGAVSPMLIVEQVKLIQGVMGSVMKVDEHYGKIPGTQKNVLFKSGAEKLCFTFQLTPEFEVREKELPGAHREIVVTCHLVNRDGRRVATGVGSCSTMESKYRYRGNELIATGEVVPPRYWDLRKQDAKKAQELIGGPGRVAKKDDADNTWKIFEKGEKGENPDIADVYNTVLKMAKKRAHVDATITATACSDIFTQDVEDLPSTGAVDVTPPPPVAPAAEPPKAPAATRPAPTPTAQKATTKPAATVVEAEFTPVSTPAHPGEGKAPPTDPTHTAGELAQREQATNEIDPARAAAIEALPAETPKDFAGQSTLVKAIKKLLPTDEADALSADCKAATSDSARQTVIQRVLDGLRAELGAF
jgi:hypothetical protein